MRPFEATGLWFVPSSDKTPVYGVLTYTLKEGLRLTIAGALMDSSDLMLDARYDLIHGVVDESPFGKHITLVDSFRTGFTIGMPGIAKESIYSHRAFIGNKLLEGCDLKFDRVDVQFSHLDTWVHFTGIETELLRDGGEIEGLQIIVKSPNPITLSLGQRATSIRFNWKSSEKRNHRISIVETLWLTVEGLKGLSDAEILGECVRPIQDFLTFACKSPNAIMEIRLSRNVDKRKQPSYYLIFQPIFVSNDSSKSLSPSKMLFTPGDLGDALTDVFTNWMAFAREYETVRNIYFGVQYAKPHYLDERFLLVSQAVALYFGHIPSKADPLASVLEDWGNKLGEMAKNLDLTPLSLKSALPSSSDLLFSYHLRSLIRDNWEVFDELFGKEEKKADEFIEKISVTRNYFLKRDQQLQELAFKSADLHWATCKLQLIFEAAVLKQIGVGLDVLKQCLKKNDEFRHLTTTSYQSSASD